MREIANSIVVDRVVAVRTREEVSPSPETRGNLEGGALVNQVNQTSPSPRLLQLEYNYAVLMPKKLQYINEASKHIPYPNVDKAMRALATIPGDTFVKMAIASSVMANGLPSLDPRTQKFCTTPEEILYGIIIPSKREKDYIMQQHNYASVIFFCFVVVFFFFYFNISILITLFLGCKTQLPLLGV